MGLLLQTQAVAEIRSRYESDMRKLISEAATLNAQHKVFQQRHERVRVCVGAGGGGLVLLVKHQISNAQKRC